MSRNSLLLILVIFACVVGVVAWVTFKDDPPAAPSGSGVEDDPDPGDGNRSVSDRREPDEVEDLSRDVVKPVREPKEVPAVEPAPEQAEIRGRIVAAEGELPAGAEAWLAPADVMGFRDLGLRSRAAEDGSFSLIITRQTAGLVEGGSFDLLAVAPGFLPAFLPDLALEWGGTNDVGDIVVTPGSAVRGRVVDTSGRAVAGATVLGLRGRKLLHAELVPGRQAIGWGGRAESDDQGEYAIEGLLRERHEVTAEAVGFELVGGPVEAVPEATGVDLVMRRLRVVTGRVVSDIDEKGIADATVRLEIRTRRVRGLAFIMTTLEDGRFAFDLSGEEYEGEVRLALRVAAAGFAEWAVDDLDLAPLLPGENYLARLIPSAPVEPGRLRGRVVYDTGEPFKRGNITISFSKKDRAGTTVSVWTDEDGRFLVPEVPPGEYRMSTALHNQISLRDAGKVLVIPPGGEENAEFVVRRGGDVEFIVRSSTGEAVTGLKVERMVPGMDEVELGRSLEGGEYFMDLAPGAHKFRFSASGHRTVVREVTVAKGLLTKEEVVLEEDR